MTTAEFNTSINSIVTQAEGAGNVSDFSNIVIDMSDLFEKVTDDTYSFITGTLLPQLGSDWSSIGSTYHNLDSTYPDDFSGMDVHFNNGTDISGSGSVDEILATDSNSLTIDGNGDDDLLLSIGSGDNTIQGDAGEDQIVHIGTGDNTIQGGNGADRIVNLGTGDNIIQGGNGADRILNVGSGDNIIEGGNNDDTIVNLGASAELQGDDGADTLIGWNGDDTLVGGNGDDVLTGGDGADTFKTSVEFSISISVSGFFKINIGWDAGSGEDTITDFDGSEGDVLQIDVENWPVLDLSSELSFNSSNGQLKIDGNLLVTLENYESFDINNDVQFI